MDGERFKITIYSEAKTLEMLDLISEWTGLEIEETATLLLSRSAEEIRDLYRSLTLATLGAER